jgi:hypothetical protein
MYVIKYIAVSIDMLKLSARTCICFNYYIHTQVYLQKWKTHHVTLVLYVCSLEGSAFSNYQDYLPT